MAATETMVFFALLFSLVASSFTIAWIANDYAATPPCTFGSSCAPIDLDPRQDSAYNESVMTQDYTSASTYDPALTFPIQGFFNTFGTWTQGSGGYELTASTLPLAGKDPTLLLKNIADTNGDYEVTYVIDNAVGGDFYILPRTGSMGAGNGGLVQVDPLSIPIIFSSTGMRIPGHDTRLNDVYSVNYPNAQQTIPGGSTFIVKYNEGTKSLDVRKDGVVLLGLHGLDLNEPNNLIQVVYYGGVSSNTEGFKLVSTTARRSTISKAQEEGQTFLEGLVNVATGTIPGLKQVLEMLSLIAQVTLWTLPEEIYPLWLNILTIKTQVLALFYVGARLARGGG